MAAIGSAIMTHDEPPRPPRRQRYRGKHPRRFEEKYKEHSAGDHPETVAKVLAAGKTPAGSHVPVMVGECLAALRLGPGMTGVDATLGFGGHAAEILARVSPGGMLLGLDQDPIELPKTARRMRALGYDESCFVAQRSNYAGIAKALASHGWGDVDFVFADLGCSSMQLDDPARGFTYKSPGPLDMRMNPQRGLPASAWLARVKPEDLARVLREHADEPRADSLALALAGQSLATTVDLAAAVRAAVRLDAAAADLTVRRVFQAVRIAVNEEFEALDAFLRVVPEVLKPGGHVVVLTFHSGEDRRVKQALRSGLREGTYRATNDDVITAGPAERHRNPRSSPAKLRWAVRA